MRPPSGTVTFLLTDLEGSTRMWEQEPEAMKAAMVRHDEILEKAIVEHRGHLFSRMGDGMAAAFATAGEAVCAADAFQRSLAAEAWRTEHPLRARVGLHTDEAVIVNDTYVSQPVNRCARLMAAAHGGQTVVSGATESLVRDELPEMMELTDLGEHRLRDLGRPMRIFELSRAHRREKFPPLRSLDSFPGNLPAQASSFIGRHVEVEKVVAALSNSRVVTITGVGGVGKTRLALQVAADQLPHYREGAWLVELAPVRDPAGVAEAIAATFHLTNPGGPSLEDALIDVLAQKQMLLVLDNCEHVLSYLAPLVGRIERTCPGVVMLATSREGMAVDGEQLIALPPLATGQPGEDVGQLLHTDAVHLFVERAKHVKNDFELSDANSRPVIEICQRLDGVPLAIELAAARAIALSPNDLAQRLDRRFQLLAGGRRGAVERHATLRAAIDWSYELLSAAEQRVLGRLSVFSGGCTLDAIEEVCSGDHVDRDAVLDLVAGLVARSLVVAEDTGLGTRYRLLETIRQYSEERLADSSGVETLRLRHARFYTDLCARAARNFYGPSQIQWAQRLNLDRDNITAALATIIDRQDAALAVQLVADHPDGQSQDVSHVGELFTLQASRVLELPGASEEPGYCRVLMVAAHQAWHSGDHRHAEELCLQALDAERRVAKPLSGPRIEIGVAALQALSSLSAGDYDGAQSNYERAAELADVDGAPGLAAMYLAYSVNSMLLGGGDIHGAIAKAEKAVLSARRSNMPTALAVSLNALALALVEQDPVRARTVVNESLDRSVVPGEEMSTAVMTASMVAARLRDWDLTLTLTAQTMRLWRWVNSPMQTAPSLALCARAVADDQPELAGVLRGAAYAAFHRADFTDGAAAQPNASVAPEANFVLVALRETGDIVAGALGDVRRHELRATGAAMTMDEAISYALANIDPKAAPRTDR